MKLLPSSLLAFLTGRRMCTCLWSGMQWRGVSSMPVPPMLEQGPLPEPYHHTEQAVSFIVPSKLLKTTTGCCLYWRAF